MTASSAFAIAARGISDGIVFFSGSTEIIRPGRSWSHPRRVPFPVSLVEIDHVITEKDSSMENHTVRREHVLTIQDCVLFIYVQWGHVYLTSEAIVDAFADVYADELRLRQISGCADDTLERVQIEFETRASVFVPRIIDAIIINDEIDLLRLRLEYLQTSVDAHIIVESHRTFTGKPKKLYFNESKSTFQEYGNKIIHIILKDLPYNNVTATWQVWQNEYFSRNAVAEGLTEILAKDEDILVTLFNF